MTKHRQAKELLDQLEGTVKTRYPDYDFSRETTRDEDSGVTTHTLSLRQGLWRGADVEIKAGASESMIELNAASKGKTTLMLAAVALAIAIPFLAGDPVLEAMGITAVRSNLTIALAAIPCMIITIPLSMLLARVLGGTGAKESERLVESLKILAAAVEPRTSNPPATEATAEGALETI